MAEGARRGLKRVDARLYWLLFKRFIIKNRGLIKKHRLRTERRVVRVDAADFEE